MLIQPSDEWRDNVTKCFNQKLNTCNEFMLKLDKIGLTSLELDSCHESLKQIALSTGANLVSVCRKQVDSSLFYGDEYLIRKIPDLNDFQEVRIAVVGNVDSGKSTLLGVLTHCELDNGRGLARQKLFRHKHELETGMK